MAVHVGHGLSALKLNQQLFSSRRWQVVFLTRRAPTRASPPLHLPMLDALG